MAITHSIPNSLLRAAAFAAALAVVSGCGLAGPPAAPPLKSIRYVRTHPVKFPEAVEKAGIGQAPALPAHLADLFEREERCTVLPNELAKVQAFVSQHGNRGKPL